TRAPPPPAEATPLRRTRDVRAVGRERSTPRRAPASRSPPPPSPIPPACSKRRIHAARASRAVPAPRPLPPPHPRRTSAHGRQLGPATTPLAPADAASTA